MGRKGRARKGEGKGGRESGREGTLEPPCKKSGYGPELHPLPASCLGGTFQMSDVDAYDFFCRIRRMFALCVIVVHSALL